MSLRGKGWGMDGFCKSPFFFSASSRSVRFFSTAFSASSRLCLSKRQKWFFLFDSTAINVGIFRDNYPIVQVNCGKWLNVPYEKEKITEVSFRIFRVWSQFVHVELSFIFFNNIYGSWIYILSLWCCGGNFHCSSKSSIFISCPRGWRHLSEYYLAIVGWLSSGSPAGDRQMFRGDPIRRPPKQCATINHQTICHPPEQSGCLDDHEPKHAQPFSSLVFSCSVCKWAYVFTAGLIISCVVMRVVKVDGFLLVVLYCTFSIFIFNSFSTLLDIMYRNMPWYVLQICIFIIKVGSNVVVCHDVFVL